jgi:CTP synthase
MRLGGYPCLLKAGSLAQKIYGADEIVERHRHRYEFNNNYIEKLEEAGLRFSGLSKDQSLVEMIEIPEHPWYVACQFHPEFTSTPRNGHPLFDGFINAAKENKQAGERA